MKILVLDNYDSFTYNLVHLVEDLTGGRVDVFLNDAIRLPQVAEYDRIILSPGGGLPEEAGIMLQLIDTYKESKSILGVCLGHQAIGQALGGSLINLDQVYHGVATDIKVENRSRLFRQLPATIPVGRYHSWMIDRVNLPRGLRVTAVDANNNIMAVEHEHFDLQGIQFHPESVLTPDGRQILHNWLFDA